MAKIYYQEDCNLSLLEGKTIAVIGYGSHLIHLQIYAYFIFAIFISVCYLHTLKYCIIYIASCQGFDRVFLAFFLSCSYSVIRLLC